MVCARLNQPKFVNVRHKRRHAVVAQATGVEAGRIKVEPSVCILTSGVRCAVSPKS